MPGFEGASTAAGIGVSCVMLPLPPRLRFYGSAPSGANKHARSISTRMMRLPPHVHTTVVRAHELGLDRAFHAARLEKPFRSSAVRVLDPDELVLHLHDRVTFAARNEAPLAVVAEVIAVLCEPTEIAERVASDEAYQRAPERRRDVARGRAPPDLPDSVAGAHRVDDRRGDRELLQVLTQRVAQKRKPAARADRGAPRDRL